MKTFLWIVLWLIGLSSFVMAQEPTAQTFIDICRKITYDSKNDLYNLSVEQCELLESISVSHWIHPKYTLAIWLSENITGRWKHWDGWCSKWYYQMNGCARTIYKNWKVANKEFIKQFTECSLDFKCSTEWTVERIKNYYCKWKINNLQISWANCIAKHQWYRPTGRYTKKVLWMLYRIESMY